MSKIIFRKLGIIEQQRTLGGALGPDSPECVPVDDVQPDPSQEDCAGYQSSATILE